MSDQDLLWSDIILAKFNPIAFESPYHNMINSSHGLTFRQIIHQSITAGLTITVSHRTLSGQFLSSNFSALD